MRASNTVLNCNQQHRVGGGLSWVCVKTFLPAQFVGKRLEGQFFRIRGVEILADFDRLERYFFPEQLNLIPALSNCGWAKTNDHQISPVASPET